MALIALMVLTLLATLSLSRSQGDQRIANLGKAKIETRYGAEAGINRALMKLMAAYYESDPDESRFDFQLQPEEIAFEAIPSLFGQDEEMEEFEPDPNTGFAPPGFHRFKFSDEENHVEVSYQIIEKGYDENHRSPNGWVLDGAQAKKTYLLQAEAIDKTSGARDTLEKVFHVKRTSLATYAFLFDSDLELTAGRCMTITGDIHTNGTLFVEGPREVVLTCPDGSEAALRMAGNISASGLIFKGRKIERAHTKVMFMDDEGNYQSLTQAIDSVDRDGDFEDPHLLDPSRRADSSDERDDSEQKTWVKDLSFNDRAKSLWGTHTEGVEREIPLVQDSREKLPTPKIDSIDENGLFAQNADLKIFIHEDGSIDFQNGAGNSMPCDPAALEMSEGEFYEGREGIMLKVTNISLAKLSADPVCYPSNGLVYIVREDARPDSNPEDLVFEEIDPDNPAARNPTGIRIINSEQLVNPISLATKNPLFVQGDYNLPPGEGSNCPTFDEGPFCPSMLVSDSVHVLSNAWSDDENLRDDFQREGQIAASTEINAAFITGTRTSAYREDGSFYSGGGSMNVFRLLENWRDDGEKILEINGSISALWESQFLTREFSYASRNDLSAPLPAYFAPANRLWNHDDRYADLQVMAEIFPIFLEIMPAVSEGMGLSQGRTRKIESMTKHPSEL